MIKKVTNIFNYCQISNSLQKFKQLRREQHLQTAIKIDQSKLKIFDTNIKVLVPNFFSQKITLKQHIPIQTPSKSFNHILNSYLRLQVPLSNTKQLHNQLIRLNTKNVRTGRLLQCMDSMAAIVGYKHCYATVADDVPFILVTGCVDKIDLIEQVSAQKDIVLQGFVNNVGKTSMQIGINLYQQNILKSHALFTMISRNINDHTKSYPCPGLLITQNMSQIEQLKAKIRQKSANDNIKRRKIQMKQSYMIKPPTQCDTSIIHNFFINRKSHQNNQIEIDDTKTTFFQLMHTQQRNMHGKIFGGYLMKQMVQSGLITAYKFVGHDNIKIQHICDFYFKQPVQVGCILKIQSRISFTKQNTMVVSTEAFTSHVTKSKQQKLCCHMQLFIKSNQKVNKIFPKSYQDGIYFLTSKKAYEKIIENKSDI